MRSRQELQFERKPGPRSCLDFDQPTSDVVLVKEGVMRQFATDHRNLVTTMQPRTGKTVFVDFVGKIFAAGDRESQRRKEFRDAREQANTAYLLPLCFF